MSYTLLGEARQNKETVTVHEPAQEGCYLPMEAIIRRQPHIGSFACLDAGNCGDHDAHPHVRQCAKVPRGVDALFPHMPTVRAAFEKTHKERCRERIKRYIDNELDPDIHERVRQEVVKIDPARAPNSAFFYQGGGTQRCAIFE